jgi:hypothetical protein
MKRVKLILKYDLGGNFEDDEVTTTDIKVWKNYFLQSDIDLDCLDIKEVIIEEE